MLSSDELRIFLSILLLNAIVYYMVVFVSSARGRETARRDKRSLELAIGQTSSSPPFTNRPNNNDDQDEARRRLSNRFQQHKSSDLCYEPGGGGLRPEPVKAVNVNEHADPPDCTASCGSIVSGQFKPVFGDGTGNTYVDGTPLVKRGYYCVHASSSVVRCNSKTSDLVAGPSGSWVCLPRWPDVFGGKTGSDIMVCGGYIKDRLYDRLYTHKLSETIERSDMSQDPDPDPDADITEDPYTETLPDGGFRWVCPTDRYFNGFDFMANRYLQSTFDRFMRVRNGCSKYIYRAYSEILPDAQGLCMCASAHGKIHPDADKWLLSQPDLSVAAAPTGIRASREEREGEGEEEQQESLVRKPYSCSPCAVSGGLGQGKYFANLPRPCVKGFDNNIVATGFQTDSKSSFRNYTHTFPCGTSQLNTRSSPCVNSRVYIGLGMSEYVRALLNL